MSYLLRRLAFAILFGSLPLGPIAAAENRSRSSAGRILASSDVLQITVVNQPELNTTARVEPDGTIVFPYAGRIAAAGLTEDELKERIKSALRKADVVKNPQVLVELSTFGTQVSILGAVGTPGSFVLDRPTTLTQALAKAGGLKEEAGVSDVILRRPGKHGVEQTRFNARAILSGDPSTRNFYLQNNDEIYVEQGSVFYLYGYVNRPGQYPINRPAFSVQQALAAGGGVSTLGSDGRIEIRRKTAAGAIMDVPASLDDLVEPNDTIVINERLF